MINTEQILEINQMKEIMKQFCHTDQAKQRIDQMRPLMSIREVKTALRETSEAKLIMEHMGNPPFASFEHMEEYIQIAKSGGCLTTEQLEEVSITLTAVKRLKDFLNQAKQLEIGMPYYEENLDPLDQTRAAIVFMIRNGRIEDHATKELKSIRMKIISLEEKMREKADAVLRSNKEYLTENFSTIKNGHICIPVKKEYKNKISGTVIDQSSKGGTLFVEPSSIARLAEELIIKKLAEENEIHNILYTLTGILSESLEIFVQNKKTFEKLDFAFAKAKMSLEYEGNEPDIVTERKICIKNGRHPLIDKSSCVPLDFNLGEGICGIVITGPNTGGKTVAIKTVGINCYLAQCGLHTAADDAQICLHNQILCDIGDGQNLSENLSTFSAHITNVLEILKRADPESLVIMDELGSGTDPTEGMGIAIAILEELKKAGCFYLATTHYPDVKSYAERTDGLINARMAFDRETLRPLYRLEIGEAGESCALYIAKKLGMPAAMLQTANEAAYGTDSDKMITGAAGTIDKAHSARLKKDKRNTDKQAAARQFKIGDSVMVFPDKKIGIVCESSDEKGNIRIQMPAGKTWINHKRVKLHVAAEALYPEDYDFSIIFDTVENRKARHQMTLKHTPDLEIINED